MLSGQTSLILLFYAFHSARGHPTEVAEVWLLMKLTGMTAQWWNLVHNLALISFEVDRVGWHLIEGVFYMYNKLTSVHSAMCFLQIHRFSTCNQPINALICPVHPFGRKPKSITSISHTYRGISMQWSFYPIVCPLPFPRSVGVVTYYLLTGVSPFHDEIKELTMVNVSTVKLDYPTDLFSEFSPLAVPFIQRLLVKPPEWVVDHHQYCSLWIPPLLGELSTSCPVGVSDRNWIGACGGVGESYCNDCMEAKGSDHNDKWNVVTWGYWWVVSVSIAFSLSQSGT